MSDELEFLQSAYLDDELDPDLRRSAEAAAASDPQKAEELRSLARVRELIAGLSRPAGPDFATEVLRRLAASGSRPAAWAFGPSLRWGAAAAVLLAASLGIRAAIRHRDEPVAPPPVALAPASAVATEVVEAAPRPPVAAEPVGPPEALARATPDPDPTGPPRLDPASEPDRSQLAAGELLARPGPHRLFVVSSVEGPPDLDEIAEVLKLTSHRDFYRLELPGDDRAEADAAGPVVFAAELDPAEVGTLRRRLEAAHPGQVGEEEAGSALRTELAELGRAVRLPAEPAAEVQFPQSKMAIRIPSVPTAPPTDRPADVGPPPIEPAGDVPSVVLIRIIGPPSE
ncbi:hypothetical protein [Paludisphaera soli]|uniref:hypothetical protein n=1 Tax=Paludisphaera soli TaxID=2712865 RepID=UPI0013EB4728|nr:hypothetical protein [Paludisphaera soli]